MNCERSSKRAWIREVAVGLGRELRPTEIELVTEAWRKHQTALRRGSAGRDFPRDFVAAWTGPAALKETPVKRTSMTRDEQERWAVSYLAANLSREEVESAETSITVQAFADFFATQWPRTFNKMAFAAKVRAVSQQGVPQGIGR